MVDADDVKLETMRDVARVAVEAAERRDAAEPGSEERREAEHELERLEDVATFDDEGDETADEGTAAG